MEEVLSFLKECGYYFMATIDDDNTEVLYFEKETAFISLFTKPPKTIEF